MAYHRHNDAEVNDRHDDESAPILRLVRPPGRPRPTDEESLPDQETEIRIDLGDGREVVVRLYTLPAEGLDYFGEVDGVPIWGSAWRRPIGNMGDGSQRPALRVIG